MAKPKSSNFRILKMLQILWKYTDANHQITTQKMNEHLRACALESDNRVLSRFVHTLQNFGIDARGRGDGGTKGAWIENRPLSKAELDQLIFAVTTNPYLSQSQATHILHGLAPFVTIYQEPLLQSFMDTSDSGLMPGVDDFMPQKYSIIAEAIASRSRIKYTVSRLTYNHDNLAWEQKQSSPLYFNPKHFVQQNGCIYMVGYNRNWKRISAVNLWDISSVFPIKERTRGASATDIWTQVINPHEYLSSERKNIIYAGPVEFRCTEQYLRTLYHSYGPPIASQFKYRRGFFYYPVENAVLTAEHLHWMAQNAKGQIRLSGSQKLKDAVRKYYTEIVEDLIVPV